MKRVVWKMQLEHHTRDYTLPAGAEILHCAMQGSSPCIWFRCDPDALRESRRIVITGTGHEFWDNGLKHVGTILEARGTLVWHVFEATKP